MSIRGETGPVDRDLDAGRDHKRKRAAVGDFEVTGGHLEPGEHFPGLSQTPSC